MAQTIDDKINQFEEKLKQLKAQKKLKENRERRKLKEQERKDNTRRKILLGAFYLSRMEKDEQFRQHVLRSIDGYLTADRDRKLFGLPELGSEPDDDFQLGG